MQRAWIVVGILTTTAATAGAQVSGDRRATELLAEARAALGGAAALTRITGLSCAGTYTRAVQDRQLTGDLTIDLQLPDKMLRIETMSPVGDVEITTERGFNGDTLLQHSATSGGGPGMVFRMLGSNDQGQALKGVKADGARLAFAMLLTSTAGMPLDLSYAGEAAAPDGTKAEALDAKGPNGFTARLFLDAVTHRPLMLTYRGIAPRIMIAERRRGGPGDERPDATPAAPLANPQVVDIAMYFDDYRVVDGLALPHHVSRSVDGQPSEEWTFSKVVVNPPFKPDTFQPK